LKTSNILKPSRNNAKHSRRGKMREERRAEGGKTFLNNTIVFRGSGWFNIHASSRLIVRFLLYYFI